MSIIRPTSLSSWRVFCFSEGFGVGGLGAYHSGLRYRESVWEEATVKEGRIEEEKQTVDSLGRENEQMHDIL